MASGDVPMSHPPPSLAVLLAVVAILALSLVAHHYLAPAAPRAGSLGQAAVSGYGHPVAAAAADQDDAATVAAMVEAGRM